MPIVYEFICNICKSSSTDPHFKIGEQYGEPLYAHRMCIPVLLAMVKGLLSNSTIKKDINFTDGSMISKDTCVPTIIDPEEEIKKPKIREMIIQVQQRLPVFIKKFKLL